ncbi:hypothetical protein Sjap_018282 [Stephania japonica]|uniref:Uncharacterized protein n=1 Tax=Stephania japonica TaxID=461633 RepID=A0AAP0I7P8_9MAGN
MATEDSASFSLLFPPSSLFLHSSSYPLISLSCSSSLSVIFFFHHFPFFLFFRCFLERR